MMESNDRSKWNRNDTDDPAQARSGTSGGSQTGPNVTLILFAVVVAVAVAFFFQNSNQTKLTFVFFHKTTSARWAIIVAIVAGILLDRLISFWWQRRKRRS